MKILKFKEPAPLPEEEFRWQDNVQRIVAICADRGFIISCKDAQSAWEEYSAVRCAGWLILDVNDDDVFASVMDYCEIEE